MPKGEEAKLRRRQQQKAAKEGNGEVATSDSERNDETNDETTSSPFSNNSAIDELTGGGGWMEEVTSPSELAAQKLLTKKALNPKANSGKLATKVKHSDKKPGKQTTGHGGNGHSHSHHKGRENGEALTRLHHSLGLPFGFSM